MISSIVSLLLLGAVSVHGQGFTHNRQYVSECPYSLTGNNSIACPNLMNSTYPGGSPLPIVPDTVGYLNGFVMNAPIALYLIWYGEWDPTEKATITTFLESLTNPPKKDGALQAESDPSLYKWWSTVTQYKGPKGPASSIIRVFERYQLSVAATETSLSFTQIESIIRFAVLPLDGIGKRLIPGDPWGIYVFLPGNGISVDGYCTTYCSLHSKMTDPKWHAAGLVYTVVGYPSTQECLDYCSPFGLANPTLTPPNGAAVDTIINALAHEIGECPVNNDQSGWGTMDGLQIGDLCNFDFGSSSNYFTSANGGTANIHGIDGSEFFVQQLWSNAAKSCVLQS